MSQKSSLPQAAKSVSQVLMSDRRPASRADAGVHGAGIGCEQNEGTQAKCDFGNRADNDCAGEHGDVLVEEPDCRGRALSNPTLFRRKQKPRTQEGRPVGFVGSRLA